MGFSIIIGKLSTNHGGVQADPDGTNVVSMSYSLAEQFAEQFPDVWTALRHGDVTGSEPLMVILEPEVIGMIQNMPPADDPELDAVRQELQCVLSSALHLYPGNLYSEVR